MFWNVGYTLKVIVASIAKVSCTKAEKDSHTATVATLVLQVVSAVLGTHLSLGMFLINIKYHHHTTHLTDVAAASADQLLGVERVPTPGLQVAPSLSSEVSLATLETDVVGVSVHGEP